MRNTVNSPCRCLMLRRAALAVTDIYDSALEGLGIGINQFSIIINLAHMDCPTTAELARQMGLDRSTIVRNLKAITAMGYVENISRGKNNANRLRVTPEGLMLLEKALPIWKDVQKRVDDALGEDNAEMLMEMLYKLQELDQDIKDKKNIKSIKDKKD